VDVVGRAGGRLARGPRPGSPRRPPLAGQVAGEIRAHQLTGDAMPTLFLDSCPHRQLGDDVLLGQSLSGYLLLASDSVGLARYTQLFTEAIACTERSGDRFISCQLHHNAGLRALYAGDIPAARAHLQQAAQLAQAIGAGSAHVPLSLGWVLRLEGDPDGARSMFEAALRIIRRNGDLPGLAYACSGVAYLAADLGDWHRAAVLHGAAQALLDRTGQEWEPGEARLRQDSVDQVRAHLGQEQFDRAYSHGTTLSLEHALDVALAEHRLCGSVTVKRRYPRTAPIGGSASLTRPGQGFQSPARLGIMDPWTATGTASSSGASKPWATWSKDDPNRSRRSGHTPMTW
jgi:hypothetical protein